MKLSDIYDQLAYGELRQVVMGTSTMPITDLGIPADKQAEIYPFVTLGITELHKRFKLREATTTVTLVANQADYSLATVTDFMQLERITGTLNEKDYEIPVNSRLDYAIRTPFYNTLTLPTDSEKAAWLLETTAITVTYRANHPTLDANIAKAAPTITEIYLSEMFLEPLLFYIASRVTSSFGASGQFHEGNNYAAKFEQSVARLQQENYDIDQEEIPNKLLSRGFV